MSLPGFLERLPLRDETRLALFDADGTLWDDDIADDFALWLIGTGRVRGAARWPEYRRLYVEDGVEACRHMLGFFAGLTHRQFLGHIETYWRERMRLPWIEPVVAALRGLAGHGFRVWVVTGSPADVVAPLARVLPVERVLGMDLEVDAQGVLTGRALGVTCAGDGKPVKVRAAYQGPVQVAVGNSSLDVPLLRMARDAAWAIHPGVELERVARAEGWAIEPAPRPPYGSSSFPPLAEELRLRGLPIPEDA